MICYKVADIKQHCTFSKLKWRPSSEVINYVLISYSTCVYYGSFEASLILVWFDKSYTWTNLYSTHQFQNQLSILSLIKNQNSKDLVWDYNDI